MRTKYVPLSTLIDEWSRQSGELPTVILTNLCDQEARGRFPPATFRHIHTGDWADPGSLSELTKLFRFAAYDIERAEAWKILAAVTALKSGVLSFCRLTGTRPPRCVAGNWRWFLWRHARHAAPPPYPSTPEEIAAESEAAKRAQAEFEAASQAEIVEDIETSLSQLEAWLGLFTELIDADGEILSGHWSDLWDERKASAKDEISQVSNTPRAGEFTVQLKELDSRYESLKARSDTLVKAAGERAAANTENVSRGTIAAERECAEWIAELASGGYRPAKKEAVRQKATAKWGQKLSHRSFERAWASAAPGEWRKPGKKRKG